MRVAGDQVSLADVEHVHDGEADAALDVIIAGGTRRVIGRRALPGAGAKMRMPCSPLRTQRPASSQDLTPRTWNRFQKWMPAAQAPTEELCNWFVALCQH